MNRNYPLALRVSIRIVFMALLALASIAAQAQAYCTIKDIKYTALSNGVQIMVKSDGIITWRWESGNNGAELTQASIRFTGARIGVEKTLFDIDVDPVSTAMIMVPQDAAAGQDSVLQVTMTQPSRVEASLSEDRLTFLLTVKGQRTVETVSRTSDTVSLKSGSLEVTSNNGLVSVRAMKANIHQVVAEIARLGGISVAIDDGVKHDVSLNVQDRAPLDVIRGIAAGYGLALSAVGDIYMLSEGVPSDLSTYQRSGTSSVAMKYLKAGDAKSLLPSFLFKYLHDNPEQNAVVVTAPSQMLDKIARDLKTVDIPPAQIMLECAVVELANADEFERNFRWLYTSPEYEISIDGTDGNMTGRKADDDGLVNAIASTTKLQAVLRSLISTSRARIDVHPSMAAVNGKDAEIFIGSQRFIKVKTGTDDDNFRLETVPVGIRLNIRPSTGGNGEITSWVKVEVSTIVQIDQQTGVPLLGTRRAETTLRTRDGDTIIIGGLTLHQDDKTRSRVPVFGSLPLIGGLFRGKSTSTSNTELVVLIRPRLLDTGGRLPQDENLRINTRFLEPEPDVKE